MFHSSEKIDPWQKNTFIKTIRAENPKPGELSRNKGYFFLVEGGSPNGKITIYAEKDHLVQISFSELFGLSDVKWINEKLLFMRPWWGRIAATDIIMMSRKSKSSTLSLSQTVIWRSNNFKKVALHSVANASRKNKYT